MKVITSHNSNTKNRPTNYMVADLHGMNRWQALKTLAHQIMKLLVEKNEYVLAIHGYHNGTVLRDCIRTGMLQNYLHSNYPMLPPINIVACRKGTTKILLSGRVCAC